MIGAILLNSDTYDTCVSMGLVPEMMCDQRHATLYTAITHLMADHVPPDIVTLSEALSRTGRLEAAGGTTYIIEIVINTPAACNIQHYVDIILQNYHIIKLCQGATQLLAGAKAGTKLTHLRANMLTTLESTQRDEQRDQGTLKNLLERGVGLRHAETLPWGWEHLDNSVGGIPKAALTVIGAYPAIGKTAFVTSLLVNAADHGHSVAFFSCEMTSDQVMHRLIALKSQVSMNVIRDNDISQMRSNDQAKVADAVVALASLPFTLAAGRQTAEEIIARTRILIRKRQITMIAVDYLQLVQGVNTDNRRLDIDDTVNSLKGLSQQTGIAVVLLSQLARVPDRQRLPHIGMLKESGGIEEAADMVALLHRPRFNEEENDDEITVLIEKNKFGPAGIKVPLAWDGKHVTISDKDIHTWQT